MTFRSLDEEMARAVSAVQAWERRYHLFVQIAACEALLPGKDYLPDGHIMDTHVVAISLRETSKGSGDLMVHRAGTMDHRCMGLMLQNLHETYEDLVENCRVRRREIEEKKGGKMVGTACVCVGWGGFWLIDPTHISQDFLDEQAELPKHKGWAEMLKQVTHPTMRCCKLWLTRDDEPEGDPETASGDTYLDFLSRRLVPATVMQSQSDAT